MHDTDLFTGLFVLFAVAFAAAVLMRVLRLPALIGFLLAGVVAGPSGLHLLEEEGVRALAELGVVLLLFTIGLELSVKQLWELRREALIGGGLQLALTAAIAAAVSAAFGVTGGAAVATGLVISLSSTAVVLHLLDERGSLETPYGRIALAVLLLQDIAVVPLTLLIPALAGGTSALAVLVVLAQAALLVAVVVLLARKAVPWLLDRITALRTREGFLLGVATIVFLITWLTGRAGLSPALGAFLAGLIISETEQRHLALAESAPFRDLLIAVFFVSVGMLVDAGALLANPWLPLLLGVVIYAGKTSLVAGIVRALGYPWRIGFKSGAALGQVGEFSFVLLLFAAELAVIGERQVQLLLAAAAVTLFLTPIAVSAAQREREPRVPRPATGGESQRSPDEPRFVLIIGYGHSGRMTARTLDALGLTWRALELNPATVKRERNAGAPIELGDASRPEVLAAARVQAASAVVVTINDRQAVRPILLRLRKTAPAAHVIVRARFAGEREELLALGADVVVPEEIEGSLAIVDHVMRFLGLAGDIRHRHIADLRAEGYRLRTTSVAELVGGEEAEPGELEPHVLEAGDACLRATVAELDLRRRTGAVAIALIRGARSLAPASTALAAGDRLLLAGARDEIARARDLLTGN
ncbi:MAG: Glutathione-regulated potassium-efflux system protein KefC [Calditrichaeota bacterium]|nr:Glutathione-regulated potassium-efflux system protein KefC [Calditrichota bacterium]